jgi:hypothetical protein
MSKTLPPLRRELDIMPSPAPDQPGLFIRDPFRYTDAMIIVPPVLVQGLPLFDGKRTELDLQEFFVRLTGGDLRVAETVRHLVDTLRKGGFLDSEEFHEMRDRKHKEFAEAPERAPSHAGSGYPGEAEPLRSKLSEYGADPVSDDGDRLMAIAAPHVSPEGGYQSYAAAYRRLNPSYADKTFVILGTSHYGAPEKFGLTRKPYVTPFGPLPTNTQIVDQLAAQAPASVAMEDYCHASEHSIEFQCIFLQHVLGQADVKAVPILCGPLAESLMTGRAPEKNEDVRRFFDALSEMDAKYGDQLVWVLGIDLAHIGRRYGDEFKAEAGQGPLLETRGRDEERLERICAGDTEGFFELVKPDCDDLRWCGYSPVYTFMAAVKGISGKVLRYEQWNIDEQSVVSFTGMEFQRT